MSWRRNIFPGLPKEVLSRNCADGWCCACRCNASWRNCRSTRDRGCLRRCSMRRWWLFWGNRESDRLADVSKHDNPRQIWVCRGLLFYLLLGSFLSTSFTSILCSWKYLSRANTAMTLIYEVKGNPFSYASVFNLSISSGCKKFSGNTIACSKQYCCMS